ncbi:NitT/TauT family transport system ATP-binding protein [Haloactinopolyspora alba]|uniref:NitT/TauT family transport system ATP-binding protein n=1 Tax=Haloactinopolyspora alba TaxID=648780 RepID=A0A2P8E2C8_9ACTN|nr:ABC transporter ATP-binding protein [Haloactinopolyspora alba]PSL03638.1 NitT/TauT family transport system ATP-binding protein [Haloactinopolyspora alba]
MSFLTVDRLNQVYTDVYTNEHTVAIDDVSFTIPAGEFVSLIGPSGCGKTTVLNIVAGFVEATGGAVQLEGVPVAGPGPDRGVVFQDFALFPWKTVLANVAFGLKMNGVGKAERQATAQEMIDLVGLSGFERKFPHELSGGMRQRAAVARVLATEPSIMLMDEPFASVDAQTRRVLQQEVLRIWDLRRTTVLFVTHDVDEAVFMSDRVIVLSTRPSQVQADIRIPIERPRSWTDMHTNEDFVSIRRELMGMLGVEGAEVAP